MAQTVGSVVLPPTFLRYIQVFFLIYIKTTYKDETFKTPQELNEALENLNISDVRRSFSEEDMEKSFKEGYNLALHHYKEYLSKETVGYDFSKDEPKDFYTFIKNYV